MKGIEVFGPVDRKEKKADGEIASHMPAWYLDRQVADMKEDIDSQERAIARGGVQPEEVLRAKNQIKVEKDRYSEIVSSRPKVKGKDLDDLNSFTQDLGKQIGESMFTRSDMKRGTADAHEEVRRMTEPIIKMDPDVARKCGVSCTNGRVSRNGATKIWQMGQKLKGEPTNAEMLRRE